MRVACTAAAFLAAAEVLLGLGWLAWVRRKARRIIGDAEGRAIAIEGAAIERARRLVLTAAKVATRLPRADPGP